ncbi:hypothetical protein ACN28C_00085 [Plantactinospora sp. WMMC1484]|uniref:hypothetical protein n=1 Tax=Plantactinospora sp. WMMC1484 TaxID=3404122 RepID=UPI003BF61D57
MQHRRLTAIALALITAFGAAACAGPGSGGDGFVASTSSSPEASAADALMTAARRLSGEPFTTTVRLAEMSAQGAMDPTGRRARMSIKFRWAGVSADMDVILFGESLYVKEDFYARYGGEPNLPAEWMRVDYARINRGSALDIVSGEGPVGAGNLMRGLVDVERDGELGFRGTVDLARSLKAYGATTTVVPFTATVDQQGRLVAFSVDAEKVSWTTGDIRASYDNLGEPIEVTAPEPAMVVEMPDDRFAVLNS